jgi:type I restriction enzyme, S subunit
MSADIAALFPSEFEESELGLIPKGWRVAAFDDCCSINSWTLGRQDDLPEIDYIEISAVNKGDVSEIQHYQRGNEPSRARRRLRHGDTVISTVRPERQAYFLCLAPPDTWVASTGFAVLTPTAAPWSFVHAALTKPQVFEYLGQQADGGAYPAIRPERIGALPVVLPTPSELLSRFHEYVAPLFERAEASRSTNQTLAALRDILLPRLISGQLRLPAELSPQEGK